MRAKKKFKKHEELWSKIRDIIRSINKNSDDYHEKYKKNEFNSNDKLPLNKMTKIHNVAIATNAVFHENKYYPQVFLDQYI